MSEPIHIISLGAGVQSSTMALMAAVAEIAPMPMAAIFADTQDEPKSVYVWLDWLEKQLPFPIHRVSIGALSEMATRLRVSKKTGNTYTKPGLPVFFNGNNVGIGSRQCTLTAKIEPINKKLRELRGKSNVVQWIGISRDEIWRMKPSRNKWCKNIWPLVDRGITRRDCIAWMKKRGYPTPPRSACVYCPYHSDAEWRRIKNDEPLEFERAALFEERLKSAYLSVAACQSSPFLHRSCVPLRNVDLSTEEERGQINMFNSECEGMCGV